LHLSIIKNGFGFVAGRRKQIVKPSIKKTRKQESKNCCYLFVLLLSCFFADVPSDPSCQKETPALHMESARG